MKKIAYEQTGEFNFDIIQYFVRQYLVFMESNILLDKIKNLFNFYTKIKSNNPLNISVPKRYYYLIE